MLKDVSRILNLDFEDLYYGGERSMMEDYISLFAVILWDNFHWQGQYFQKLRVDTKGESYQGLGCSVLLAYVNQQHIDLRPFLDCV